jgi:integrase
MALNDTLIRAAKPLEREWKLADEKGLYLLVTPSGGKLWRLKFRVNGKEKKLSLGAYPAISLKEARRLRDIARAAKADGADPAKEKQAAKIASKIGAANSFELLAEEYIDKMVKDGLAEATLTKARWFLSLLRPAIGREAITNISAQDMFAALKKVERAGHRETAKRLRSFASRVFRYAVATGRTNADPAETLRGALASPIVKHYAAITDPIALGELMRMIEGYSGEPATLAALRLTPHVFQRPGEVRQMQWAELDLDKGIWTIRAERMKQRTPHAVPLSRQSLSILLEMRSLTGNGKFVFPSIRTRERPMSENTVNGALRRLGFTGSEMTAHGFRSTASTLLNESGKWNPDAIERALSHAEKNQVRAAYNRGSYWAERVEMAQWWSDYLDRLRDGGQVIALRSSAHQRK